MIPETVTLTARRNATFAEEYDFTDETGAAIDLTGCTAKMQVRLYGNAPGSLATMLSVARGGIEGVWINDPANGKITVQINQSTLAAMPTGGTPGAADVFAYDLMVTWSDGVEDCFIEGRFILNPGVTR